MCLTCASNEAHEVHIWNVPQFEAHFQTLIYKQLNMILKKIQEWLNCATFCATFVALVAHISNVPHFVAHGNGILMFPKTWFVIYHFWPFLTVKIIDVLGLLYWKYKQNCATFCGTLGSFDKESSVYPITLDWGNRENRSHERVWTS